jgi:hypothetical protein
MTGSGRGQPDVIFQGAVLAFLALTFVVGSDDVGLVRNLERLLGGGFLILTVAEVVWVAFYLRQKPTARPPGSSPDASRRSVSWMKANSRPSSPTSSGQWGIGRSCVGGGGSGRRHRREPSGRARSRTVQELLQARGQQARARSLRRGALPPLRCGLGGSPSRVHQGRPRPGPEHRRLALRCQHHTPVDKERGQAKEGARASHGRRQETPPSQTCPQTKS